MIREKLFSVVIEVTLDQNDGGTLVTTAGGQVAQRTDQVGQTAGSGAFRSHITSEVVILGTDGVLNGFLQGIAAQVSEVVVSQILELQLIGTAFQTGGSLTISCHISA